MQTVTWGGHQWAVETNEYVWKFSRENSSRMGMMSEVVPLKDATTVEEALAVLTARKLAKMEAENAAYLASQKPVATNPARMSGVGAVVDAIERGMSQGAIEAALEGREHKPGRKLLRCPRCGTRGYSGGYPFSTGYNNDVCDDCG